MTVRSLVLWCPDWPVRAAAQEAGLDPDAPLALIDRGLVHACSSAARAAGVQRGLKVREAQSRCSALVVLPLEPAVDARRFEPVLAALEAGIPTVQVVRPGLVVIRAAGPARFFGGEEAAAGEALHLVAAAGVPDARAGIADGPFTAEQAARSAGADRIRIVPVGGGPAFLAPLPVALLGMPGFAAVLAKLGVRSLGALAALDGDAVRDRFGPEGDAAHRVAAGLDPRRVVARTVPADRDRRIAFEPPLDRVDRIAFAMRTTAEAFIAGLAADLLVCTGLTVELVADGPSTATGRSGSRHRRTWLHPRSFTPLDVVDRVRWQLDGARLGGPVTEVVLHPESVDAAAHHEEGLWGGGPDERIHHALSRVQSMLGHEAVLTVAVGGGRLVADRRVLAPWGERRQQGLAPWGERRQQGLAPQGGGSDPRSGPGTGGGTGGQEHLPPSGTPVEQRVTARVTARAAERPWPGRLPGFAPTAVLLDRPRVVLLDPAGAPVAVDDRGAISGPPAVLEPPQGAPVRVDGWAGPWPLEERWWDAASAARLHRLQLTAADGTAWLLAHDAAGWWAEARYD